MATHRQKAKPKPKSAKTPQWKRKLEEDDIPGYMQCEPLGVTTVGDEVEDDIMGDQRYITLPDGRLRFHHVDPMPALNDGPLPLMPSKEEVKARAGRGYTFQRSKNPIALGPIINRFVDGEAWADRMNKVFESVSDVLPRVPFFLNVYGTINAGKTSTLITLLNMLTVPGGFTRVMIGSKSLGKDPMLATWLRSRNPGIKVELRKKITEADLADQARKVEMYYAPYFAAAVRGRLYKVGDHDAEDEETTMRPYDSIVHPHTDNDGIHHHRRPHLPDYSSRRAKDSPWLESKLRRTAGPGAGLERIDHTQQPLLVLSGDVIRGRNLCLEERVYNAVNLSANYQEAAEQLKTQRISSQKKNVYSAQQEPEPTLFIMEDAARSYDSMRDAEWIRLCSMIRHMHGSAVMLQQKHNTVPLFIRTIETDAIIFGTKCEAELDSLRDNYGATVEDFDGKLFACTQPVPGGPDRGFMYVKKREPDCVYRCFEGRLQSSAGPSVV